MREVFSAIKGKNTWCFGEKKKPIPKLARMDDSDSDNKSAFRWVVKSRCCRCTRPKQLLKMWMPNVKRVKCSLTSLTETICIEMSKKRQQVVQWEQMDIG